MAESGAVSVFRSLVDVLTTFIDRAALWFWLLLALLSALILDQLRFLTLADLGDRRREEVKCAALLAGALLCNAARVHAPLLRLLRRAQDELTNRLACYQRQASLQRTLRSLLASPSREAAVLVVAYDTIQALADSTVRRDTELFRDLFTDERQAPHRTIAVLHVKDLLVRSDPSFGYLLAPGVAPLMTDLERSDKQIADNMARIRDLWRVHGRHLLNVLLPESLFTWEEHASIQSRNPELQ